MISYLQIDKLTKSFGDLVLFEDITFGIAQGQKVGLIAKNGTGKTTLLNIIAGKEDYDSGAVVFRNDLRVGYLEQMPHYPDGLTVLQACFYSPNETVRLIAEYEQAMASGDHSNLEDILLRMDNLKAWDYEQRTKQILGQLKIHNFDQKVETLSGGQLKRVALANVLITDPELIILDEPTNHLDNDMVLWLEDYLRAWKGALVMVTHDRYFLERIVGRMAEVEDGRLFTYEGNYDKYLERKAARLESERASERKRQAILRREYQWVMQGPTARGTKSRERLERYEALKDVFTTIPEKQPIRRLSKGMQKQSAFWLALCCRPDILVLDEPVDGLDPVMRRQVWSLLMGDVADHGTTVLVSSHNLRELEDVCDHVGILSRGKVLIERSLSALQENVVKMQVVFQEKELPQLPGDLQVLHVSQVGRIHTLIIRGNATEITNRLAAFAPILMEALPLTLEEIFIYELGGEDYAVRDIVL